MKRETIEDLVKEILGDELVMFEADEIIIKESLKMDKTHITCDIQYNGTGLKVDGHGSGVVDALFNSISKALSKKYCSFEGIEFVDFLVSIDTNSRKKNSATDSYVRVDLEVRNSSKKIMHFAQESRSMISAAIKTTLAAIQYFLNCELAVIKTYEAIKKCEEHNVYQAKDKYVARMALLVENTSYEKTISRYKGGLN